MYHDQDRNDEPIDDGEHDKNHQASIVLQLSLIIIGSLADAILTYAGFRAGILIEANPIWTPVLAASPAIFFYAKMLMTIMSCIMLWLAAKASGPLASFVAWIGVAAYAFTLMRHCIGMYEAAF